MTRMVIGNSKSDKPKVDQLVESLSLSIGTLQTSRIALLLEENRNSDASKALEQLIAAFAEYVEGLRQV